MNSLQNYGSSSETETDSDSEAEKNAELELHLQPVDPKVTSLSISVVAAPDVIPLVSYICLTLHKIV